MLPFPDFKTIFRSKHSHFFLFQMKWIVGLEIQQNLVKVVYHALLVETVNLIKWLVEALEVQEGRRDRPLNVLKQVIVLKPNYFNQQKYYSLIFKIFSCAFICFVTDTSTIYRNCYLWLRYDENTTNFQDYNPSLVQQKIVKYSCNDTAKEGTCAFEGKGQGGPGMKRRRRQAGPGPPPPPPDKPNICQGTDT